MPNFIYIDKQNQAKTFFCYFSHIISSDVQYLYNGKNGIKL